MPNQKLYPNDHELQEFYLCGAQIGYSTRSQALDHGIVNLGISSAEVIPVDCAYCPSWHVHTMETYPLTDLQPARQAWDSLIKEVF